MMTPQKEKEKNPHTHSPTMECSLKEKEKKARTHSPKMECLEKEEEMAASGNVAENPVKKPVKKEKKPYTLSPPEKQVKKMESSLKEEEKPHTHSPPAASEKQVKKMESSLKEEEKPHTHSPPAASGDLAGKPVKKMESSLKEEEKPHTHSPPAATGKPVKKPPVKERLIGCFSDENFEIGEGIEKFMPSPGTGHTFVKKRASLSSSGCRKSLWDIVKGQLRDKRDKEQRCCVISTDQAKQAKEEKRPSTDWFSKYEKPATRDLNSKFLYEIN
nr:PREDICTED: muscle M-line assembly protein unc-89-like isoform X6 [Daucus carota subsp. sativus]